MNLPVTYLFVPGNRPDRFGKALASSAGAVIVDLARLRADLDFARACGFSGKLCIHPTQVAAVHDAMRPGEAAVAWARRVVTAAGGSDGAISVDGRMVDRPVIARARRILDRT